MDLGFLGGIGSALGSVLGNAVGSKNETTQTGDGFWGSLGDTLLSPEFLSSALGGAASLGGMLIQDKKAKRNAEEDRKLQLQDLALKAKYGLIGGGGGGSRAAETSNLLNTYKARMDANTTGAAGMGAALQNLMMGTQASLLRKR